jgi:hypothetical protein
VLDEELSRLPDHYRGVVVLCDLEGLTRKEAARQLSIPEGSVASRLARARGVLAKRLTHRGVVFSGASVAAVLSEGSASVSAPPALVASTIKAASLFAAGHAASLISVKVVALTEGVLKSMLLSKLKIKVTLLLVAAALSGAAGAIYQLQAADRPKVLKATERTETKKVVEEEKKVVPKPPPPQPTKRQRQLRWKIVFNNKDGNEYAKQLEALGARLAIPTKERNQYRVICDLSKRPVTTTIEVRSKMNHKIVWMDDNKQSIQLLSKELGLKEAPEHIIVFLPKFVEDELLRRELSHSHRLEEDIEETTFSFSETKSGFDIKVASQR